jgi:hypothetical protein
MYSLQRSTIVHSAASTKIPSPNTAARLDRSAPQPLIEDPVKTFLACALGQRACERGISVRYYRASRLFEILTFARGDGSFGKLLTQLSKSELLIIDDRGLEIPTQPQCNDLLEIIEDHHDRSAPVILLRHRSAKPIR